MSENAGKHGAGRIADQNAEFSRFAPFGRLKANHRARPPIITTTLTVANTPVQIIGWQEGPKPFTDHIVLDGAAGTITIGPKGRGFYVVELGMSFSSNRANTTIHSNVYLTSGGATSKLDDAVFERSILNVGAVGNAYDNDEVLLYPGDILDMRLESSVVTTIVSIRHGGFGIRYQTGG